MHSSNANICSPESLRSGVWQHLLKLQPHQPCYQAALHHLQSHRLCYSDTRGAIQMLSCRELTPRDVPSFQLSVQNGQVSDRPLSYLSIHMDIDNNLGVFWKTTFVWTSEPSLLSLVVLEKSCEFLAEHHQLQNKQGSMMAARELFFKHNYMQDWPF